MVLGFHHYARSLKNIEISNDRIADNTAAIKIAEEQSAAELRWQSAEMRWRR